MEITPHYKYYEKTTGGDVGEILESHVEIHKIEYQELDIIDVYSTGELIGIADETLRVHEQRNEIFDEAFGWPFYREEMR